MGSKFVPNADNETQEPMLNQEQALGLFKAALPRLMRECINPDVNLRDIFAELDSLMRLSACLPRSAQESVQPMLMELRLAFSERVNGLY